jgi:hypothetical protein
MTASFASSWKNAWAMKCPPTVSGMSGRATYDCRRQLGPQKGRVANLITQIFRITGGNDKQGFPMKQGVVRLALQDQQTGGFPN